MSEALLVIVGALIGVLGTTWTTWLGHRMRRRDEVAERVRVALLPVSEAHAQWATAVWSCLLIEDSSERRERVDVLGLDFMRMLGALADASADPEIGRRSSDAADAVQGVSMKIGMRATDEIVEAALESANIAATLAQRAARRRAYPRTLGERWRGWRLERANRERSVRVHVPRQEGKS
ncbi:hypothetical protein [Isoptericola dokdonensis]|uniref:Uncharacterized protein n=1 Tax=Isoptericola dokdonensis DS-3 TaxID=1300344 RepID=A0A161IDW0_9MICO|nr:hypothetical protein [Isoptericola dokdonensis]ANC31447.1 hypothetical protein I598_1899 [Isoptericola dokdonensis DS-3]